MISKIYQELHNLLKEIYVDIVQASLDTRACYGVSKCANIVFERTKMMKGEELQVLHEIKDDDFRPGSGRNV